MILVLEPFYINNFKIKVERRLTKFSRLSPDIGILTDIFTDAFILLQLLGNDYIMITNKSEKNRYL